MNMLHDPAVNVTAPAKSVETTTNWVVGRAQVKDCSSFGAAVHHGEFCRKSGERNCRPLACAQGMCDQCKEYDDAIHVCPKEYTSDRVVRYKTKEPVSSGGKVFEDWVYKECKIKPFLRLLKDFYQNKYRFVFLIKIFK